MDRAELRRALEATCPNNVTPDREGVRHTLVPFLELQTVREAAEKHLATLPNTKMVEVWRVESSFYGNVRIWQENDGSKASAENMALYLARDGHTCIRVTGPHMQEVPA